MVTAVCFLLKFSTEPTTPEGVAVKPDKPPPGRTARPLPRSSRKCDEKLPSSSKTDKNDTCDADESENDAEEQVIPISWHTQTFHRF